MENKENKIFKKIKNEGQDDIEKEREENEEELRQLQEADAVKGDLHSTDKSDIPLGVEENEYIESFSPDKNEGKEEEDKNDKNEEKEEDENEKYYDSGIRPRVKFPPRDESDEWPLIIPDTPLKKEETGEDKDKEKKENKEDKEDKEDRENNKEENRE